MSDDAIFEVPKGFARKAWVDEAGYRKMYEASVKDPETFWAEHGRRLDWIRPFTKVKDTSFTGDVHIRWFEDATLNASANCLDRTRARSRGPSRTGNCTR